VFQGDRSLFLALALPGLFGAIGVIDEGPPQTAEHLGAGLCITRPCGSSTSRMVLRISSRRSASLLAIASVAVHRPELSCGFIVVLLLARPVDVAGVVTG
jgi:hypothetical protein